LLPSGFLSVYQYASRQLQVINCKKRYRFKKATLYEREVLKKQKFFIRWQKLPCSYNVAFLKRHRFLQLILAVFTYNSYFLILENGHLENGHTLPLL
jgi:hypothetical protein